MSAQGDIAQAIGILTIVTIAAIAVLFLMVVMENDRVDDLSLRVQFLESIHPATHGSHGDAP